MGISRFQARQRRTEDGAVAWKMMMPRDVCVQGAAVRLVPRQVLLQEDVENGVVMSSAVAWEVMVSRRVGVMMGGELLLH